MPAINAATVQVLSTRPSVYHSHRPASCDTSLCMVSGGVDSRRRRRNVYDKKPQRYAKDNRTAHLTARSDKSVAYTWLTFCTVDANYWQTRSIAWPLCDNRATCLKMCHSTKGRAFHESERCSPKFWETTPQKWNLGPWIGILTVYDKIQIIITWTLLSR